MSHPGLGFPIPPFQWPRVGHQWPLYNLESDQAEGLVAWLPALASRGANTLRDLSAYGNDGDLNGPTWTFDSERGPVLDFDGSNDYVNIPDDASLDLTTKLTVAVWMKQPSLAANEALVVKWDYQTQGSWGMQTGDVSDEIQVFIADSLTDVGNNVGITTDANMVAGMWYHVAFVYDGNGAANADRLKIYVNGEEKTVSFTGTIAASLQNSSASIKIGEFGGTLHRYFDGLIDEPRIYRRAFNALEDWQLYDPLTRWELYQLPRRVWRLEVPLGVISTTADFQSALREVAAYVAAGQAALGMASAYVTAFQSALKEVVSSSVAGQAALRGVSSVTAAAGAALAEAYANTAAFAASLGESVAATAPYQAVLGMATSTAVAFQSVLSEVAAITAAANAVFTEAVAKTAAFNASLSESVGASAAAQAALKMVSTFTAAGRAALAEARSTTIAGYAVLGEVVATTVAAAARLVSAVVAGVADFAAVLQELVASTAAGRAAIAGVTSVTAAVSSRLASLISAAVGLRAALGAATAQTVATRAYLSRVVAADMVLFARPLTASAKARPVSVELFRRTLASEVPDR